MALSGHRLLRCFCTQSGHRACLNALHWNRYDAHVLAFGGGMRRRDFIKVLGSGAVAWPLAARAQQAEPMRRIGVLMSLAAGDKEGQARLAAFLQRLQELGWIDGRNMRVDTRWGAGDGERARKYIAELVALTPDVILASGGSLVEPLLQATRTVPIVFTQTPDPVGAGFALLE